MSRRASGLFALLALVASQACGDSPAQPGLSIEATGVVRGVMFVDLNGSGEADQGDVAASGWKVNLYGGNGALLTSVQTDTSGAFRIPSVPVGSVRIGVDSQRLGDTLQVLRFIPGSDATLSAGDTALVSIGLTYPKVPIDSVAAVPLGRRVFVEGIALNGMFAGGPRDLHLRGRGVALRAVDLERQTIAAGDSVRVLGRRAEIAGQPILDAARVVLVRAALDVPQAIGATTGEAASARGGAIPAELVRVRAPTLSVVRLEQDDVVLTVNDGSGDLEIVLRAFLSPDSAAFDPTRIRVREATGLLVPYVGDPNEKRWRLTPRSASDVRTELIPPTAVPSR